MEDSLITANAKVVELEAKVKEEQAQRKAVEDQSTTAKADLLNLRTQLRQ